MRWARPLLAAVSIAWIVLLATAPSSALGVPISALAYAAGSLVCHQRPERSFHIGLAQIPVCARCYGLYLGAALGAFAALKGASVDPVMAGLKGRSRSTEGALRLALVAASLPTVATWIVELIGLWSFANVTRFLAALPLGVVVALTVARAAEGARPPSLR